MGAYLLYKLINPGQAAEACAFLDAQPEQKELNKYHSGLWFWTPEDKAYEEKKLKEKGYGAPDFMKIGEGEWKASSAEEPCYELVAQLFKKLHTKYHVKIYRHSCALNNDYFTEEQIRMITRNGEALSREKEERIKEKRFVVPSEINPDKKYTVVFENNRWKCSCPGWVFHNHGKTGFECKHIRAVKDGDYDKENTGMEKPEIILAKVRQPTYIEEENKILLPLIPLNTLQVPVTATICHNLLKHGYSMAEIRERYHLPQDWTKQAITEHIEKYGEFVFPEDYYKKHQC